MANGGTKGKWAIGNRIAPARFLLFALLAIAGGTTAATFVEWRQAIMLAFDGAAILFLLSCLPLFRREADAMRASAEQNDANRAGLLAVTGAVMLVILVAIASELTLKQATQPGVAVLIVATLVIAWLFSNFVYTLHYAHMFYRQAAGGGDRGGIEFPHTHEPDYWDFTYFAFTLGMTFQTSDVVIADRAVRRVATAHTLAAFFFNIGVLAFTINVLGS
ncbi:DUF1345 domain-containing protein [Sphingomonas sp. KC8]|uniref:DUF1345 domain-containing protein n=1 Tax=Sphingomonas sp. KC8 TaxID=1030157 RepID=UPI0002489373|nr:DUF1345 domain-containing protein [Sphingomonas sp. KC8]ARS28656.1 hypothetical protein KC8_15350 [Sphingomonas sp. KC8]